MMLPSIFGENLFDNWVSPTFDRDFFGRDGKHDVAVMKTDVKETDGAYEVAIDLPGYKKEDVAVKLENGTLTVAATTSNEKEEKDKDGQFIRKERYYGNCSRQFYIGDEVKKDDISAKMNDGILTLTIPKKDAKEVEESKRIAIEG
ncbi:MAG: Hsp20/alpha crystallin family protein [Eubacteriaceae bacterium]|nr:Hsp20/alpha crystallin family protein [Eubacteriaceae bacterium]